MSVNVSHMFVIIENCSCNSNCAAWKQLSCVHFATHCPRESSYQPKMTKIHPNFGRQCNIWYIHVHNEFWNWPARLWVTILFQPNTDLAFADSTLTWIQIGVDVHPILLDWCNPNHSMCVIWMNFPCLCWFSEILEKDKNISSEWNPPTTQRGAPKR